MAGLRRTQIPQQVWSTDSGFRRENNKNYFKPCRSLLPWSIKFVVSPIQTPSFTQLWMWSGAFVHIVSVRVCVGPVILFKQTYTNRTQGYLLLVDISNFWRAPHKDAGYEVNLISLDVLLTKLEAIMTGMERKWMNTSFFCNNKHTTPHLSHARINHPHLLEEFLCHDQLRYNEGSER